MNTNKTVVTATELKNNTSEILNKVVYGKEPVSIERHGKVIADIVPRDSDPDEMLVLKERIKSLYGAVPDFPEVHKDRKSRKRLVDL